MTVQDKIEELRELLAKREAAKDLSNSMSLYGRISADATFNAAIIDDAEALLEIADLMTRLHVRMESDSDGGMSPHELTKHPDQKTTWLTEIRAALAKLAGGSE